MKRILGFLGILMLSLLFITSCGKNEIVEIKDVSAKNVYEIGEFLDLRDASVTLVYEDGSTEVVPVEYEMVNTYDIINMYAYGVTGEKTLTVTYIDEDGKEFTTQFTVNIIESAFKATAKETIDSYKVDETGTTYSAAAAAEIALKKHAAKAAVNSAKDQAEVDAIVKSLKDFVDSVKTLEQEAAEAAFQAQLEAKLAEIAGIKEKLAALESTVNDLGGNDFTALQNSIEAVRASVNELEVKVNAAATKEELEAVEDDLEELTGKVDDNNYGSLADRIKKLEDLHLDKIDQQIENTVNSLLSGSLTDYIKKDDVISYVKDQLKWDDLKSEVDELAALPVVTDLQFRVTDGAEPELQWSVDGQEWETVAKISDIAAKGEQGDPGEPGQPGQPGQPGIPGEDGEDGKDGINGIDGKPVELDVVDGWVQWRYKGEDDTKWNPLFEVGSVVAPSNQAISYKNGVIYLSVDGGQPTKLVDLNEVVDEKIAISVGALVDDINDIKLSIEDLEYNVEDLDKEVKELKAQLTEIFGDELKLVDLDSIIREEAMMFVVDILNEYLGTDIEGTDDLVDTIEKLINKFKNVKNLLVEKLKEAKAELLSSKPIAEKVLGLFNIVMDYEEILKAAGLSDTTIDKIDNFVAKLRAKIVPAIKAKINSYLDKLYSTVYELYSVKAFVNKYSGALGSFGKDFANDVDYDATETVKESIETLKELVAITDTSNIKSNIKKIAIEVEALYRVDTIHQVGLAYLATELEKAYQDIVTDPDAVLLFEADTQEKLFNAKEAYKNRLLTTKGLLAGFELYIEGLGEVNPLAAFIEALKAIEEINFESVRDNEEELRDQIELAQKYLDKAYELFDDAAVTDELDSVSPAETIKALGDAVVQDPANYPTTEYTDLLDAFQDVKDYFAAVEALVEAPYSIVYDLAGGVNNPANPTEYYVRNPETLLDPTREGYRFEKWTNALTGELVTTTPIVGGGITVVANWTAKEYKLTLENYDGASQNSYFFDYDEVIKGLPTDISCPEGRKFANWSINGVDIIDGVTTWTWAEDAVAEAVYVIGIYTITFETNGGTAIAPIADVYGTAVVAPADPTKEGHEFAGWYSDAALTVAAQVPATIPGEDVTLYAKWNVLQYTVEYVENGGTEVDDVKADFGTALVEPTISKDGYTFDGWYEDKDFNGVAYTFNTIEARNVTLYAKWNVNHYTIVFDANLDALELVVNNTYANTYDAKWFTGALASIVDVEYDKDVKLPKAPYQYIDNDEVRAFRFAGWTKEDDAPGLTPDYVDEETVKNLTAEDGKVITLYAQYEEAISSFILDTKGELDYVVSGIKYGDRLSFWADPKDDTVKALVVPLSSVLPGGTSFLGWAELDGKAGNRTGVDHLYDINDKTLGDFVWLKLEDTYGEALLGNFDFVIRFEANGGQGTMADQDYTYASGVQLNPNQFTKEFMAFAGWNTEADGSGVAYDNEAVFKEIPANAGEVITIYAQWTYDAYTIVFDGNGATAGTMANLTHTISQSIQLLANKYERTGYVFAGWNTKADGTGVAYADLATLAAETGALAKPSDEVTLYAQWTANTYYVVFNANGKGTGSTTPQILTYDKAEALKANPFTPTEVFYSFAGWKTKDGVHYADEAEVMNLATGAAGDKVVTLYAQWNEVEFEFIVDFNNDLLNPTRERVKIKHGQTYLDALLAHYGDTTAEELYKNSIKYYGHVISYWRLLDNDSTTLSPLVLTDAFDANYENIANGQFVLEANWVLGVYDIKLISKINGFAQKEFTAQVTYGQDVYNTFGTLVDQNDEYEFVGWFIYLANGSKAQLTDGMKWIYEDEPIYAEWVKK